MTNTEYFKYIGDLFDVPHGTSIIANYFKEHTIKLSPTVSAINHIHQNHVDRIVATANNLFHPIKTSIEHFDAIIFLRLPEDISPEHEAISSMRSIIEEFGLIVADQSLYSKPRIPMVFPSDLNHVIQKYVTIPRPHVESKVKFNVNGSSIPLGKLKQNAKTFYIACNTDLLKTISREFSQHNLIQYVSCVHVPIIEYPDIEYMVDHLIHDEYDMNHISKIDSLANCVLSTSTTFNIFVGGMINYDKVSQKSIEYHSELWPDSIPLDQLDCLFERERDYPMIVSFRFDSNTKLSNGNGSGIISDLIGDLYQQGKAYLSRNRFSGSDLAGGRLLISNSEVIRFVKMLKVYGCPSENIRVEYSLRSLTKYIYQGH